MKYYVTVAMATVWTMVWVAVTTQEYYPENPPNTQDLRCEVTENDPDADCIFGIGGQDYPVYSTVPYTQFTCAPLIPGIYGDPDADCQVYHMCLHNGKKFSFLCPNGTMFNQAYFICDLWFNVDCQRTEQFYHLNENIYKDPEPKTSAEYSK